MSPNFVLVRDNQEKMTMQRIYMLMRSHFEPATAFDNVTSVHSVWIGRPSIEQIALDIQIADAVRVQRDQVQQLLDEPGYISAIQSHGDGKWWHVDCMIASMGRDGLDFIQKESK
jgi:hypothetical protein